MTKYQELPNYMSYVLLVTRTTGQTIIWYSSYLISLQRQNYSFSCLPSFCYDNIINYNKIRCSVYYHNNIDEDRIVMFSLHESQNNGDENADATEYWMKRKKAF
jgi:hypothetical protein